MPCGRGRWTGQYPLIDSLAPRGEGYVILPLKDVFSLPVGEKKYLIKIYLKTWIGVVGLILSNKLSVC